MPDWVLWAYYMTGGPALALLALWGLRQLSLAKRDLELSRRALEVAKADLESRIESERSRLTVDMCLRFSDTVLPLINDAYSSIRGGKMPSPRDGSDRWELESYDVRQLSGFRALSQVKKAVAALNAMETVAIPLARGAADANLARDSIGVAFVEAACNLGFVIAHLRFTRRSAFPCVRALTDQWLPSMSPRERVRGLEVFADADEA